MSKRDSWILEKICFILLDKLMFSHNTELLQKFSTTFCYATGQQEWKVTLCYV